MKTTASSITLKICDISDSIEQAIERACEASEHLATGVIGPSFNCSGPGSGWQQNYGVDDYAARSLRDDYGALGYVDASDGRLATLNADGEVVWSDGSVVKLVAPTADDIESDVDTVKLMLDAIESGHCIEGAGDWDRVRALYNVSEADALARWDMEIIGDSVLYTDENTHRYYLNDRCDLIELRELMGSSDEKIAMDAFSHWCAACPHTGEYETLEEALEAAK